MHSSDDHFEMSDERLTGGSDDFISSEAYVPSDWNTILEQADLSRFTNLCDFFPNSDDSESQLKRTDSEISLPLLSDIATPLATEYQRSAGAGSIDTESLSQQISMRMANSRPANVDWEGLYKFTISFEKEGKLTNGTDWTFSNVVNKLYVSMDTSCPLLFHTSKSPPIGTTIRASPAFLKPKHTSEVVQRCLLHRDPKDPTNLNCTEIAEHLVRCEAMQATYHCESVTQRKSVTVPYIMPAEGMDYICYVYKFMCFCSCTGGGISKRPLQIIFTLEYNGVVIGRKVMNIRICASPGRDRKTDEEKDSNAKKGLGPKRGPLADKGHCSKAEIPGKRHKALNDADVYILHVKGKKNFKTLKYLNELMQFRDAATRTVKEEDESN